MTTQEQAATRAPAATLKAIGHGRTLKLDEFGVPAMLVCVARETSDHARPVVDAVREKYPKAEQVLIANVADLRGFPKLLRKVAEQLMKSSYNHAVEHLDDWKTPEQYVLIAPDWDGAALGPLGVGDVSKTIAVVVIDRDANVIDVYQGDEPAKAALEMLARAGA